MNANHSIRCTVSECENHCKSENYCSLGCVSIGTHESDPKMCQCVDCESFIRESRSTNSSAHQARG